MQDLTYEEYTHAAAHIASRIQKLNESGCVAIDQLLVKWSVEFIEVLRLIKSILMCFRYISKILNINLNDRVSSLVPPPFIIHHKRFS